MNTNEAKYECIRRAQFPHLKLNANEREIDPPHFRSHCPIKVVHVATADLEVRHFVALLGFGSIWMITPFLKIWILTSCPLMRTRLVTQLRVPVLLLIFHRSRPIPRRKKTQRPCLKRLHPVYQPRKGLNRTTRQFTRSWSLITIQVHRDAATQLQIY